MSVTSDKARHDFKATDDVRDAGLTTPDDIRRYDDIVYGESPKWQVHISLVFILQFALVQTMQKNLNSK